MTLKKQIDEDLKQAMKGRDEARVTVLRGLKSAILDTEIKDGKRETGLTDEEIEMVVAKEVKKRREAIEFYEADGRGDLVEEEEVEIKVLNDYMAEQMSDEEINEKIDDVLSSLPEGELEKMGVVIGQVKMLVGSGADGARIARLVKERLK